MTNFTNSHDCVRKVILTDQFIYFVRYASYGVPYFQVGDKYKQYK